MREDYLSGDNGHLSSTDREIEKALRPLSFDDFTGQYKIVENIKIFVLAARKRGEPLDHVLLHGPPGLGKTTLTDQQTKLQNVTEPRPNFVVWAKSPSDCKTQSFVKMKGFRYIMSKMEH